MTDEEMAKKYYYKTYPVTLNTGEEERKKEVTDIFLAGLKAGKPKWHKVADGDLPNTEREVLVFMWGSYYLGYYKQYDGDGNCWHFEDFDEESEQVIAWCEIPKYTDKE